MADTWKIATVTAAIKSQASLITIVVDGTNTNPTIYDPFAEEIPNSITPSKCPCLVPRPAEFITEFDFTRDTFGADAALKSVNYRLNYRFFFAPVLESMSLFSKYTQMCVAAAALWLYFATHTNNITGATEILPRAIPTFGPEADWKGTNYHGCELAFDVMQFMEA